MTGDWWSQPGDLGTLQYKYSGGIETSVQLPRGQFFAQADVDFGSSVTVSVAPHATPVLSAGQTQQFIATVQNTSNQIVTWSLNTSVGTISNSGLYTPPSNIISGQTVTVMATSNADPGKFDTVAVAFLIATGPPPTPDSDTGAVADRA